jgi:hypothetical protein
VSNATATVQPAASRERRHLFRASSAVGWVTALACFLLFAFAADRVLHADFLPAVIQRIWVTGAQPSAIGGQWVVALLLGLAHLIPGVGPELLVVITAVTAATILGVFAALLRRRNWPVWEATLAALLVALHPVMLWLATTGQPALLATVVVGMLILSLDRAEAIGDAQSLMGLGISAALLFLISPNAIYVVLPVLMLLPVALRGMDSAGAALSLLLLTVIPSFVVVGGILVATISIGLDASEVLRLWSAPLHGSRSISQLSAPFLAAFGGRFFAAFWVMLGLSFLAVPTVALVGERLVTSRAERRRPATALMTLLLAPFGGAVVMMAMHQNTPIVALAYTMAASMAWLTTTNVSKRERVAWLLLMAAGDAVTLYLPWVWEGQNGAWLRALLGGG